MNWIVFAFVGTIAQLIDGALGMGFGLTSSTLLVTLGASAAVASAAGEIPNFTGVGQDYERPSHPDLVIDGTAPIDESVEKILKILL